MPKVVFVNEHRIVDVPPGKNLKTLALELGLNPHREFFRGLNCGYFGLCGACQLWVREGSAGATNPPNFREKMAGMRGERRLACQVRLHGDVEVTTMPGGDDRLRAPRPIAAPPRLRLPNSSTVIPPRWGRARVSRHSASARAEKMMKKKRTTRQRATEPESDSP